MSISKEFDILQKQSKKIILPVTVASKETNNQAPLTLPTSVGSAEKNYRKGKKQAVSPALERDGLRNNRHTAMVPTHNNHSQRCRWLMKKQIIRFIKKLILLDGLFNQKCEKILIIIMSKIKKSIITHFSCPFVLLTAAVDQGKVFCNFKCCENSYVFVLPYMTTLLYSLHVAIHDYLIKLGPSPKQYVFRVNCET